MSASRADTDPRSTGIIQEVLQDKTTSPFLKDELGVLSELGEAHTHCSSDTCNEQKERYTELAPDGSGSVTMAGEGAIVSISVECVSFRESRVAGFGSSDAGFGSSETFLAR